MLVLSSVVCDTHQTIHTKTKAVKKQKFKVWLYNLLSLKKKQNKTQKQLLSLSGQITQHVWASALQVDNDYHAKVFCKDSFSSVSIF